MPKELIVEDQLEAVIGLEIHVELLTKSKMFCGCRVAFGAEPNTNVCPVCLGMPGALPVINKKAVAYTIKTGLALNSEIALENQFHRKNYFYPDMPKNYQISQYDSPLCVGGYLDIELNGKQKRIGLTRIHLEEDTGKMLHQSRTGRIAAADYSLVDFNRAGTPLMEIVSEPDIKTPAEARVFMQKLRQIIVYLGVSDGNMEEGSLRCDANISLRRRGDDEFGVKTEVKNMNSFRALQRALEYEMDRQKRLLTAGERIVQETRHWDAERNVTSSLRSKEEAHDYRYFPEPDLVPLRLDIEWVKSIKKGLPELPAAKEKRYQEKFGLSAYDAAFLADTQAMGEYFEATVKIFPAAKKVANWIMGELAALLNESGKEISDSPVKPEQTAELLQLMEAGTISGKMAKEVYAEVYSTGKNPAVIVEEKGLSQISDQAELERLVEKIITAHPRAAAEFKAGKKQALGYLIGMVMKESSGQANPKLVNKLMQKKLQ